MKQENYKLPVYLAIGAFAVILIVSIIYSLGDTFKPDKNQSSSSLSASDPVADPKSSLELKDDLSDHDASAAGSMTAIIKTVDLDSSSLTLWVLSSAEETTMTFTGATDIRTSYDRVISAALLKQGDFVDVTFSADNRLLTIRGSETVWSYKNLLAMSIDPALEKITVYDDIYRYNNSLLVLNGSDFVGTDNLSSEDVLAIYGIDNYIYLIKVTKGHGQLKLANYDDFVGGTLYIGEDAVAQVTDELSVTLTEGEYDVRVENLELSGSAHIKVSRNIDSVFDLSMFSRIPVIYGDVSFVTSPEGADLYIDGVWTFYKEPVSLSYGSHTVSAELGGYSTFTGTIEVGQSAMSYSVSLVPAPEPLTSDAEDILYTDSGSASDSTASDSIKDDTDELPDYSEDLIPDSTSYSSEEEFDGISTTMPTATPTPVPTATPTPEPYIENTSDEGTSEGNTEDSTPPTITIRCTEGAAVYIDDVYKGVIGSDGLTIPRPEGTVSVRLTKEGYSTRRYTVTIDPDEAHAVFTFPDMTAN